jgi:fibronectin-binding autotransporter adhesin
MPPTKNLFTGFRAAQSPSRFRAAAVALAVAMSCGPAFAVNRTWNDTGMSNNWSSTGNWTGAAIPTLADDLFFGSSFNSTTIDLDVTGSSNSVTITTGVSFTISPTGTQNLILNSGSLTRLSTASGTQTINAGVLLNSNGSWAIDGAGRLVVNGVIADGTSTFNLTKSGTGLLVLGGSNTFGGTTSITSGTILLTNVAALQNSTFTTGSGSAGTLSFGSLTSSTFGALTGANNLALSNTSAAAVALTVGGNNASTTYSGTLSGAGGLTKAGTGTLTLTGQNTYTGTTSVTAGTLALGVTNALAAGSLTVNGGILDIAGFNDSLGLVTLTSGTIQGTTGVLSGTAFTVSSGLASAILSGTNLTKTTTGTVTLTGANTYTGTTGITAGVLNIQNALALGGTSAGSTVTSGAALQLQGGIAVGNEALTLSGSGVANNGALRSISGTNSYAGTVTLATASRINSDANLLTLSGNVTSTNLGLTVGGSGNTTISGTVGLGSGSLIKDGTGTLTLSAANTYTGTTGINAGVVNIRNALALGGTAGSVTVASGAALELQGNIAVGAEPLTISGSGIATTGALRNISGTNSYAGAITLAAASEIASDAGLLTLSGSITGNFSKTFDGAGSITSSGTISGSGGLVKNGAGTLTLSPTNTYTGNTTLNGGVTSISNNLAFGGTAGSLIFANGATLQVTGTNIVTSGRPITLNSGGATFDVGIPLYLTGTITGGGGLATGGNDLILNRASGNNAIGPITVNSGRLFAFSLGSINGSTISVANGATLDLNLVGSSTLTNSVSFTSGAALANRLGALTVSTTNATFPSAGTMIFNQDDATTTAITVNGNYPTLTGDLTVQVGGLPPTYSGTVGTVTLSGTISGAFALNKTLSGTLILGGNNTFSGGLNVNGGVLQLSNTGALNASGSNAVSVASGATLRLNGNSPTTAGLSGSGTVENANVTSSTMTLRVASGTSTFAGTLANGTSGTLSVVKTGSGTQALTGTSTYSGTTNVQAGTLAVGTVGSATTAQSLGTNATVNLGVASTSSGVLQYTGVSGTLGKNVFALGNGSDTIQNAGSGLLTLSGTLTNNNTKLTLKGGASGINVTGRLSGSGTGSDLIVSQGLTTLSTTASYAGSTFIQDSGTLALGISNAIPSTSIVTIGNAAGAGRLTTGTFTNAIGGLLFSGSGGTVAIAANQTVSPQITTSGTINLAGTSRLDLTGMQTSASVYKLISGGTFLGTFGTVVGLDSTYILRYGTLTPNELDAQRRANQAATFTMTTGGVSRALVSTNVAVSGTITNSTPAGGSNLSVSLSSGGVLTVGSLASGTSSLAPLASTAITGTIQTGTTAGTRTWSVINTDTNAITTTSTASGSLQVVNQRVFTPSTSTIALGNVHAGTVTSGSSVAITSVGLSATTASGTLGTFTGGPSGYTFGLTSGSAQFVGATSPQTATYTLSGSSAGLGAISGTYTSAVAAEFGSIPSIAIAVTGTVYSGQSTWATNGGGNWGTLTGTGANAFGLNWGTNQGSPGLDAAFTTTDTATFGSVLTGGTAQVFLSGATPSLKSLTFDNSVGSYEIYPSGGSGPIVMKASGTSAAINVLSGTHSMHSDVVLGASTVVNVATGADFTFHTEISGSSVYSLTKSGAGTMNVIGNNSFAGNTFITGGSVVILSGTSGLGSGTVSLTNGSVLNLNFLPLGNVINTVSGTVLNAADSQSTINVSGSTTFTDGPFTKGIINVLSGGVATFNNALGQTGTNSATLTVNAGGQAFVNAGTGTSGNIGVLQSATATISGTSYGSITATGSGSSLAVINFNGVHEGDLDIFNGGVVNFAGSNTLGSTFNVGFGGFASVTGTIGGELHVSGTATVSGSVLSGADMIVEAGGRVSLLNTASFAQPFLLNDGQLVIDRTTNSLTLATEISGTGLLQKTGTGSLTLTGSSSFTGGTLLDAGSLYANGSLGSGVNAAAGSVLGGTGSIAGALTGAGLVGPGASAVGILTAGQFDPTGGLDAAFEITALTPNYAVSGTGALNDVLRLTDSSPFGGNALTAANTIDVYFSAGAITPWQHFDAGFFTTLSGTTLVAAVQGGNFNFWAEDPSGSRIYNGKTYASLTSVYSDITSMIVKTRDLVNVDFGSGGVVPVGSITEFVAVPEPGSLALVATGLAAGVGLVSLRRRRGTRLAVRGGRSL